VRAKDMLAQGTDDIEKRITSLARVGRNERLLGRRPASLNETFLRRAPILPASPLSRLFDFRDFARLAPP